MAEGHTFETIRSQTWPIEMRCMLILSSSKIANSHFHGNKLAVAQGT